MGEFSFKHYLKKVSLKKIMYYIYFPYIIIISLLMLWECTDKEKPKWWALVVLCAPVTAPWFVYQSRKSTGITIIMLVLMTFSLVVITETYLYKNYMDKARYAQLSPQIRQMILLADNLKASTAKFDDSLRKLEAISKVESRIHEIKKTIDFIGEVRAIEVENKIAISLLENYLDDYNSFFVKKDLTWLFNIKEFYHNHNVVQHYKSLKRYLDSFEKLLTYSYVNFYKIKDVKSQEHLQNYDQYYIKYRRDVDSHNKFNVKRIEFQNKFLEKYPEVQPYLPSKRQTNAFKIWG